MGAKAEVDFSGDGAQILRTLKSIESGFDAITKQIQRQEEETKKTAAASQSMLDKVGAGIRSQVRDLAAMATGWLTIQGAIRLATNEYEKYKQKTATQASTVEQFNTGISAAMQNAPAQFTRPQVESIATSAAAQAGVSPVMVASALGPTFAAGTGNLSGQGISGLMAASASISPNNQEDFTAIAGGAVSFTQYLPNGQSYTPQEILGFLIGASRETQVDRLSFYVPEAAKVAAGARSYGLDVAESIAIFNAISRGIKDDTGELSRTQTLSILKALSTVRQKNNLDTDKPSEILKFILGRPGMGRQVNDDLNTRAPTEGFVGSIFLDPNGIGQQFLADSFANTPTMQGAAGVFSAQAQRMGGSALAAAGRAGQAIASIPQLNVLGNPQQAERAVLRGALEQYLQGSDSWAIQDTLSMAQYDLATGAQGQDASDFVSGVLRPKIQSLRSARSVTMPSMMGESPSTVQFPPTADAMRQANTLEQILAVLTQIANNANASTPIATNGDRPALPFDLFGIGGRTFGILQRAFDPANARPASY